MLPASLVLTGVIDDETSVIRNPLYVQLNRIKSDLPPLWGFSEGTSLVLYTCRASGALKAGAQKISIALPIQSLDLFVRLILWSAGSGQHSAIDIRISNP